MVTPVPARRNGVELVMISAEVRHPEPPGSITNTRPFQGSEREQKGVGRG